MDCFASRAMTNALFSLRPIGATGKSLLIFGNGVKAWNQKYFRCHVGQITGIDLPVSPARGAAAVVTYVVVGCGGR
jgi:hypothetical protein